VPDDVPTERRGANEVAQETRRFALRARAGVVVLINGFPGIAIAPAGHVEALLQIGIEDGRIQTIDIVGDADRLKTAVLALPQ
jgi:RNA polymerase sigma-70 factor (ECF subfamily)